MTKTLKISIGDLVAYSAAFLRNTGQISTGAANIRGEVLEVQSLGGNDFVTFACTDGRDRSALASNLAKVGSVRFSDANA